MPKKQYQEKQQLPPSDYGWNDDIMDGRRHKKEFQLREYIYNSNDGTILGRTSTGWVKIGVFYGIFYGILAALVAICFWVFFQTLDPRTPKWRLERSLIGTNPGLGFRPLPADVESTLIWYKGSNYEPWTDALDSFLDVYKVKGTISGKGQNIYDCKYNDYPPRGQVCDVDVLTFKDCSKENHYLYHKSTPCIFLKLNRIYGWVPEYYNSSKDLPEAMPQSLKDKIVQMERNNSIELNNVWVTCEGENPADLENIGPIQYFPAIGGFPGYYFPYENSEGYLSPLVAINFKRPMRGIIINVECKAWARNIIHNRKDRLGSVHFELMVD